MDVKQEPKYQAVAESYPENDGLAVQLTGGYLINRKSGERIPSDEPVFVFRARDVYAAYVLRCYLGMITDRVSAEHQLAVSKRIADFENFALDNPERMKKPD